MSNEELAVAIRAGERDKLMELWGQVRRFALWRARRWARVGRGVTVDDLEQAAFIALLDALERWKPPPASESGPWQSVSLSPTFYHERGGEAMSNEELAVAIRAGERDKLMELWGQVRRFALWRARRWARVGRGVTVDDLEQAAFIALLDALERWREADGPLLSVYALRLKAAFTAATGRRTQRDRLDPLDRALSLDAPLNDDPDADTLEAVVEDPAGAAAIEEAEAHSDHQQLHGILGHALGALPAEQREVVRRRYYRGQTVAEIAAATGTPEKEVRKLEAAALRALRHPTVSRVLRAYR